jgi:hypothetical protein
MERQAAPHQGIIVHEQNRTSHRNSLYRIECLVKSRAALHNQNRTI